MIYTGCNGETTIGDNMLGNAFVNVIVAILALGALTIIWTVWYCITRTVAIVTRTTRRVFN